MDAGRGGRGRGWRREGEGKSGYPRRACRSLPLLDWADRADRAARIIVRAAGAGCQPPVTEGPAAGQVNTSPRRPGRVRPDIGLNVAGTEWIIIVFAVLVLVLGTNKLPEAAKKFGRAVNEYNRAKEGVKSQVRSMAEQDGGGGVGGGVRVGGPVQTEREKLEAICDSLGIAHGGRTDAELRRLVAERMGADNPGTGGGKS